MAQEKVSQKRSFSPFITRINAPSKSNFDKYYEDVSYKEIYRKAGIDEQGEEFGTIEIKAIVSKKDIKEYLAEEAKTVGIAAYMKALAAQGTPIEDFNTEVDKSKVVDFSQMPDTLAEVLTSGDKAKEAFAKLDPALKGHHTTIEGFLGDLSSEKLEAYIKGKIDAYLPKVEAKKEGE